MGKPRVIAETGAGQHGVATATVAARYGMECVVYMGSEDIKRQAQNVFRMKLLGATVVPVESGSKTLKDALNEAMRDWVTNVENTFYIIGTVAGPHPYPMMVRDFQSVIGRECLAQMPEAAGRQPDCVIACVGGGSNAMGIFYPYIAQHDVQADRRRGGGRGHRDRPACRLAHGGTPRRAARQSHVSAAGRERADHRDALGVGGPRLSRRRPRARVAQGHAAARATCRSPTTRRSRRSTTCCRIEGIIPALESAHALAYATKLAPTLPKDKILLVNLSGRGDKDMDTVSQRAGTSRPEAHIDEPHRRRRSRSSQLPAARR